MIIIKRDSKSEFCILIMFWIYFIMGMFSSIFLKALSFECTFKVHIVQLSLVLGIFVMVVIFGGYHGLVNCGLRKWCYSVVTKRSGVPQVLVVSLVEEIVWMKKYKKHGPHTCYKFFSTIAVIFIRERLTRVITDANSFTESKGFFMFIFNIYCTWSALGEENPKNRVAWLKLGESW